MFISLSVADNGTQYWKIFWYNSDTAPGGQINQEMFWQGWISDIDETTKKA